MAAFKKAQESESQGDWKAAIAQYEKALVLAPHVFGEKDQNTAAIMNNLAGMYQQMGQYSKAEPLLQRSLKIYEDKFGKHHPEVAQSLTNLAALYQAMGQHAKAEPLYQSSLQILENKLGKDHPDVAQVLNNLADLYREKGQYRKAEPLLLRSLQIREDKLGKDDPKVAETLITLANLYFAVGLHGKAEPLFIRSLQILVDKLGKDHLYVAFSTNNLAELFREAGQYAKAEPLYQRSLRILEDKLGKDHPGVAQILNNLALLYAAMGQYAKAEPLYQRALQILEDKLGQDHPTVARSLNNLAELYREVRQHAKAEALYQRSLKILENTLGKDHPTVALVLNNLALIYDSMGEPAKAESLFQRVLQIQEDKLGKDHPDVAQSLNNLAALYQFTGQSAKAEPLCQRSLKICEDKLGKDHAHLAKSLCLLALIDADLQRWPEASVATNRSRRIIRRHVSRTLSALSEREQLSFLETKDKLQYHVAQSLGLARRTDPEVAALSAAWELNGKAVNQEILTERASLARASQDPGTAQLAKNLADVRHQLAAWTLKPFNPEQGDQRREQIGQLTEQEQGLSRKLSQASGRTARDDPWVELPEVRKALSDASVLIEFSKFSVIDFPFNGDRKRTLPARYAAWIIPAASRGQVQIVDLGPADTIDTAVRVVRTALEAAPKTIRQHGEPDAEKQLREPLDALAKLVLEPLLTHIGKADRWFLSPDANLWLVPWGALPLPGGKYAIEDHPINYLVSGRDLVTQATSKTVKPTRPLVLADPDFDLGLTQARAETRRLLRDQQDLTELRGLSSAFKLGTVARLPGTAAEAEAVVPSLKTYAKAEPRVYTGPQALVGVVTAARHPRVLVLSTHGFFLPDQERDPKEAEEAGRIGGLGDRSPVPANWDNPLLRCGLLLAGCNHHAEAGVDADNGVLTGLQIVGTDLRGTELVVLSACETGLGEVRNGEGVAGLRQAFQLAGAEAVVATLWKVPDRSSAQLMVRFFGNLAKGQSKAEALRNAQLALIKERRDNNAAAHPFYWAAFTLTGK
jgi:CHAT domain-containing protein